MLFTYCSTVENPGDFFFAQVEAETAWLAEIYIGSSLIELI
jgi:hypothetical protein